MTTRATGRGRWTFTRSPVISKVNVISRMMDFGERKEFRIYWKDTSDGSLLGMLSVVCDKGKAWAHMRTHKGEEGPFGEIVVDFDGKEIVKDDKN